MLTKIRFIRRRRVVLELDRRIADAMLSCQCLLDVVDVNIARTVLTVLLIFLIKTKISLTYN